MKLTQNETRALSKATVFASTTKSSNRIVCLLQHFGKLPKSTKPIRSASEIPQYFNASFADPAVGLQVLAALSHTKPVQFYCMGWLVEHLKEPGNQELFNAIMDFENPCKIFHWKKARPESFPGDRF